MDEKIQADTTTTQQILQKTRAVRNITLAIGVILTLIGSFAPLSFLGFLDSVGKDPSSATWGSAILALILGIILSAGIISLIYAAVTHIRFKLLEKQQNK